MSSEILADKNQKIVLGKSQIGKISHGVWKFFGNREEILNRGNASLPQRVTCTRFSLNSRNRSASGAPQERLVRSLDPAGGLPFPTPLSYVHPLVQFINTPLAVETLLSFWKHL